MKTIELETLTPETRQVVEGWLADESSVMLLRDKQMYAELFACDPSDGLFDLSPEEEEELEEVIRQGDDDFAAGRYITLEEFKIKYADRLSGKAK